jgi:hypothetical protein
MNVIKTPLEAAGEVFDVVADIRRASHRFGRRCCSTLSAAELPPATMAMQPTCRMPPPQRITRLKRKGGFGVSAALPAGVPPPMP